MTTRLRIAIQKSGRLSEDSFALLKKAGIKIHRSQSQLFCHSENFPLDVLLVRDDDIPNLIMDGLCDYGIVGTNVLEETRLSRYATEQDVNYTIEQKLDFGDCRLCIAVPELFDYKDMTSLNKLRIATSYPRLLRKYLDENSLDAEVTELSGSVEIAPRLGLADAICDLVSTGATIEANNLKLTETIFNSNAVLIKSNRERSQAAEENAMLLQRRFEGVAQANESKYIMLHARKDNLDAIIDLLPGAEAPTILPLAGDDNKVVVHAVCRESIFWGTLENLKQSGANSILVLPVEKMMA